jgi:hypothetical protein
MSTPSVRSTARPLTRTLVLILNVFSTEKRKGEAERIRQKYPDRIPVRRLNRTSFSRLTSS